MRQSIIEKVMLDCWNDGRFFSALVRLKKNGRFARVNGKVYGMYLNKKNGETYAVVKNYAKKNEEGANTHTWQTVVVNRILQVKKDGYRYT